MKDTKFEGEDYNDFLCPFMVAIEFFRSFEIGPRKEQIPKSSLSFDVSDLNPPGLTSFLFSCKTRREEYTGVLGKKPMRKLCIFRKNY